MDLLVARRRFAAVFSRALLRICRVGWSGLGATLILKFGCEYAWKRWLSNLLFRLIAAPFNLRNRGEPVVGNRAVPLYGVRRRSFTLPALDASLLYTEHFEPRHPGARADDARICLPVIIIRTPYSPFMNEIFANLLAERGYHVVVQDMRGRYNSEGQLKFLASEKEDAPRLVEWACKQTWCKGGKVGLFGFSMDGYSAYSVLAAECERLKLTSHCELSDQDSDGCSESPRGSCLEGPMRISAMALLMSSSDIGKRGMLHSGALCLETMTRYLHLMLFTHKPRKLLGSARLFFFRSIYQCFDGHKSSRWKSVEQHLPLNTIDEKIESFSGLTFGQTDPVWELHADPSDPYWNVRDHSTSLIAFRSPSVDMPQMSFTTGWYDVFVDAMIADYETAQEVATECGFKPPRLFVGPWTHWDEKTKDFRDILHFFDCSLKDANEEEASVVQLFMLGCGEEHVHSNGNTVRDPPKLGLHEKLKPWDNEASALCDRHPAWRRFPVWPPPNAALARLSLAMANELSLVPNDYKAGPYSGARNVTFTFDPSDPPCPKGGARFGFDLAGRVCNREMELRNDVLVFTSPALECGDLEVVGRPVLTLLLSADSPSCDIFVRLCDVEPCGRSVLVCDGFARVGGIGGAPSNPTQDRCTATVRRRPVMRKASMLSAQPEPIRRGSSASILSSTVSEHLIEPLALEVVMYPTAAVFRVDHRVRICIAGGAFPMFSRNLGNGKASETATEMRQQRVTLIEPSLASPNLASIGACLELPVLGGPDRLLAVFPKTI